MEVSRDSSSSITPVVIPAAKNSFQPETISNKCEVFHCLIKHSGDTHFSNFQSEIGYSLVINKEPATLKVKKSEF